MSRLWITTLVAASLIALAVACSSSEDVTPQQAEPTSAPAVSAQAQPTEPPPTTAPAPTSAPSPAAAVSTSTSVPATVAPTSTSAPAPTAVPQSVATSDASAPATVTSEDEERDLEIVTLLPFDAIPAILEPEFVSAEVASEELEDHNLVLGLSINGDHRAYSIPTLSAHEIVNDTVGGKPVAVTW